MFFILVHSHLITNDPITSYRLLYMQSVSTIHKMVYNTSSQDTLVLLTTAIDVHNSCM